MLTADIARADLGAVPALVGDSILIGGGVIKPYAHRLLRTDLVVGPKGWALAVTERYADEDEGLHSRKASPDDLKAFAASVRSRLFDYLLIELDFFDAGPSLRLSSGEAGAAPVYLRADPKRLRIDWDILRLVQDEPLRINADRLALMLARTPYLSSRTLFADVAQLTPLTTALWAEQGVELTYPKPWCGVQQAQARSGADPSQAIFGLVCEQLRARPLTAETTAVEVSGGIDSAATALAAKAVLGQGIYSYGATFSGEMGSAQKVRRQLIIDAGGFQDLAVPATICEPYSANGARRLSPGVYPADENYPELFHQIGPLLQAAGVDATITGLGGDELYPELAVVGQELATAPNIPVHNPLATPRSKALCKTAKIAPYPLGALLPTCWEGAAGRAARSLRYGLWPVHPYNAGYLASFTAALPVDLTHDRTAHRKLLTRLLGDATFEGDYVKETFRPLLVHGLQRNGGYIAATAPGLAAQAELIDTEALHRILAIPPSAMDDDDINALFFLMNFESFAAGRDVVFV